MLKILTIRELPRSSYLVIFWFWVAMMWASWWKVLFTSIQLNCNLQLDPIRSSGGRCHRERTSGTRAVTVDYLAVQWWEEDRSIKCAWQKNILNARCPCTSALVITTPCLQLCRAMSIGRGHMSHIDVNTERAINGTQLMDYLAEMVTRRQCWPISFWTGYFFTQSVTISLSQAFSMWHWTLLKDKVSCEKVFTWLRDSSFHSTSDNHPDKNIWFNKFRSLLPNLTAE